MHLIRLTQAALVIVVFLLPIYTTLHAAENVAKIAVESTPDPLTVEEDLETVSTAIEEIQSWLIDANARQSSESQNLREAEQQMAEISQAVTNTQRALNLANTELAELNSRRNQLQAAKSAQADILQRSVRAAYMAGDQNPLKLLLNQEDLSKSGRILHYSRVFSAAQVEKITAFEVTLIAIASVNEDLESTAQQLTRQQETLQQQVAELDSAKANRQQALAELNTSIASRSSELEQLELNQVELQQLIEQINRALERIASIGNATPFPEQRGKLPLPVTGTIVSRFGSLYGEGALSRQGITISVEEGTPVQAVHGGRVVFSNWLQGMGLLVIVDHGDSYMSLYGGNQDLSKQAGEIVTRGEVLATSGAGGSLRQPGLYFEIRHQGQAENPDNWLAARIND